VTDAEQGVSVVLGGTHGIGAAVARRLARPGSRLVLGYLQHRARAEAFAKEIGLPACEVRLVEGHLGRPETVAKLTDEVRQWGGRCVHLVHSVAVTAFKPMTRVRPNQWDLVFEVSARSFLDTVLALLEPLARGAGSVVAISSLGSVRHIPHYGPLGPAKAALESTVRQLAVELAPRGVRVNAVRAGLVSDGAPAGFPPENQQAALARTPAGRLGTADEMAAVVEFLLGPGASWMVGQVVDVDGGFSLT
jgi:enoyl-[acyl-carrier protein] reductase III